MTSFSTVTISSSPWHHPDRELSRLHLDVVPEAVVHGLAAGDSGESALRHVSPYLAGPECRSLWRFRSEQIQGSPADRPWITRLMIDPGVRSPVGVAGFHGPPGETGMVEIGYRVDPTLRRRGYARRSLEILLAVAHHHPDVLTVRATVSPENLASRALIGGYGFVETGEQWDEEDGLEIIYEVPVSAVTRGALGLL